jgi:hypothetical protein
LEIALSRSLRHVFVPLQPYLAPCSEDCSVLPPCLGCLHAPCMGLSLILAASPCIPGPRVAPSPASFLALHVRCMDSCHVSLGHWLAHSCACTPSPASFPALLHASGFPTWLTCRHPRLRLDAITILLSLLQIACHFFHPTHAPLFFMCCEIILKNTSWPRFSA